jgi:lysozyme family protein
MGVKNMIDGVIAVEGGYVHDLADSGGETCWGITSKVARAAGYNAEMKNLPRETAFDIYYKQYVVAPGFDLVIPISEAIAEELVDTGVNMGPMVGAKFLQRALNALNDGGTKYLDLVVDGGIGKASLSALAAFLKQRGTLGEEVILKAMNGLQCARYIEIAEAIPKNERFVFGWLANRVA